MFFHDHANVFWQYTIGLEKSSNLLQNAMAHASPSFIPLPRGDELWFSSTICCEGAAEDGMCVGGGLIKGG